MSGTKCPNCGADLSAPQSVRIAEYRFGHLTKDDTKSDITYQVDRPDTFTVVCTSCNRLVRTLPLDQ